ncbi:hypothetical protein RRG08_014181, partial [Elysia crispata]
MNPRVVYRTLHCSQISRAGFFHPSQRGEQVRGPLRRAAFEAWSVFLQRVFLGRAEVNKVTPSSRQTIGLTSTLDVLYELYSRTAVTKVLYECTFGRREKA